MSKNKCIKSRQNNLGKATQCKRLRVEVFVDLMVLTVFNLHCVILLSLKTKHVCMLIELFGKPRLFIQIHNIHRYVSVFTY